MKITSPHSALHTPLLFLILLISCKTQKQAEVQSSLSIDSVAHSSHYRTIHELDSLTRNIDFTFDTLEICIERPAATPTIRPRRRKEAQQAKSTEVIRLKATKGNIQDQRQAHRQQTEVYNRLDTTHYQQAKTEQSAQHTATTRIYNPPSGTAIFVVGILAVCGLFIYFRRK